MGRRLTLPKPKTYAQYGIIILVLKVFLSYTVFDNMIPYSDTLLSLFAVLFLGLSILNKGYTIKMLFVYGIVALLGLYSSYCVGNVMLFITILTILAIYNENRIIFFLYKYEVTVFVALSILSMVTGNVKRYVDEGMSLYLDFGFSHPNVAAAMLFNIMIMWIWLSYDELKPQIYLKLGIFSFAVYFFTGARTILIVGLITIFLVMISKSEKKWINEGLAFVSGWIVPILSLAFWYTTVNYQSSGSIIKIIDTFMTGRLKLGAYAYEHYGFTLFGQVVEKETRFGYDALWNMSKFSTFDNLYTKLMINNGIIWLVIIAVSFFCLSRRKNNIMNCMIIIWAIYGISEGHGLNGYLCFPILFLTLLLGENRTKETII